MALNQQVICLISWSNRKMYSNTDRIQSLLDPNIQIFCFLTWDLCIYRFFVLFSLVDTSHMYDMCYFYNIGHMVYRGTKEFPPFYMMMMMMMMITPL